MEENYQEKEKSWSFKMICLDSSFVIDFLNEDQNALTIYDKYSKEKMFIAEITIFEVSKGLLYSMQKRKSAEKQFDKFFEFTTTVEILPLMNLFAMEAAKISASLLLKGKQIDDNDVLISGMMVANGVTKIITKNVKHFSMINGLEVISY